jgi:hypothetical protein
MCDARCCCFGCSCCSLDPAIADVDKRLVYPPGLGRECVEEGTHNILIFIYFIYFLFFSFPSTQRKRLPVMGRQLLIAGHYERDKKRKGHLDHEVISPCLFLGIVSFLGDQTCSSIWDITKPSL